MDQEIGWNKLIEQVPECAKEKSSVFSIGWASLLTSFATWVCVSSIANAQGLQPSVDVKPTAGFFDIVFSGGWFGILIMLAIIGLSILAAYLIFDQVMVLRRKEVLPPTLADEVRQYLSQGRVPEADEACRRNPSPLAFVIVNGLSELDFGWQSMEKAMEDAVAEQSAKMYRKIEYLSVIGNLAPMCGLLGTVTGMIMAFQQVAASQGSAGAADLAEGIYSALATTVAGLVVAIPSLAAFAMLRNRVDQLVAEIAFVAQHVFTPVRRRVAQPNRPAANPPTPPRPRT